MPSISENPTFFNEPMDNPLDNTFNNWFDNSATFLAEKPVVFPPFDYTNFYDSSNEIKRNFTAENMLYNVSYNIQDDTHTNIKLFNTIRAFLKFKTADIVISFTTCGGKYEIPTKNLIVDFKNISYCFTPKLKKFAISKKNKLTYNISIQIPSANDIINAIFESEKYVNKENYDY